VPLCRRSTAPLRNLHGDIGQITLRVWCDRLCAPIRVVTCRSVPVCGNRPRRSSFRRFTLSRPPQGQLPRPL